MVNNPQNTFSNVIGGIDIKQGDNLQYISYSTLALRADEPINIISSVPVEIINFVIDGSGEGRFISDGEIKYAACTFDPTGISGAKGLLEGAPVIQGCDIIDSSNQVFKEDCSPRIESCFFDNDGNTLDNTFGYCTVQDVVLGPLNNTGFKLQGCAAMDNILADAEQVFTNEGSYGCSTINNVRSNGVLTDPAIIVKGAAKVLLKNYTGTSLVGGDVPFNVMAEDGGELCLDGTLTQTNNLSRFGKARNGGKIHVLPQATYNLTGGDIGDIWDIESKGFLGLYASDAAGQYVCDTTASNPHIKLKTGAECHITDANIPNSNLEGSDLILVGTIGLPEGGIVSTFDCDGTFSGTSMCKLTIG